ncbi:MAG: hypothetical protein ACI4S4_06335 [Candidatus Ornithospirochaeta sp.]
MKKMLAVALAILLVSSVFAGSASMVKYSPYPRDYRAMGEAGLSLGGSGRGFFVNPASFSTEKFSLVVPSLEVGVGSISDIVAIPFSSLMDLDAEALDDTMGRITGLMPLLIMKASLSLSLFGFGGALDASGGVFTSGEGISAGIVPFVKIAGTIGCGHSFDLREGLDLEVGIAAHTNLFFYSSPLDISSVGASLTEGLSDNVSMNLSSLNLSFDVGSTLRLGNGFSSGLVLSGLGKGFEMKDIVSEDDFTLPLSSSLDVGFGWERVFWKWLGIKAAVDIKDLSGLIKSFSFPNLLYHTNMGLGINFTKGIGIMCGLKGGFPSLGVDLKLFMVDVFVLYTVDEYSDSVGYNPRDTLSLVARLEF